MRKINISYFILILIISFGILFTFNANAAAWAPNHAHNFIKNNGDGFFENTPNQKGKVWYWDKLTDKQKKIVRKTIKELKSQSASKKEIGKAIAKLLEKWGIKHPGKKKFEKRWYWDKLTDQQKKIVLKRIKELKIKGASKEEIQEAIAKLLKDWGIKRN